MFLAASKFAAGILGHSAALVSDAVDSASDIFSNLIVMAGIKISHKASDMEHQYGHERMECVASIIMSALLALAGAIIMSALLALAGAGIGFAGIQKILHFSAEGELAAPDGITLAVAALAIISKEGMYWYTSRSKKNKQRRAFGRRPAPPQRRLNLSRQPYRHQRRHAWLPHF